MASGNTLNIFTPYDNEPPSANFATLDTRNSHPVLDFDAATDETAIFTGVLPRHYSAGGITITLIVAATTATTGIMRFDVSFERMDTSTDLDADSFAAVQSVNISAPATSGAPAYSTIAFTNAQIDGLLVGEAFRLKVARDADNVADDMAGDAELLAVELKET